MSNIGVTDLNIEPSKISMKAEKLWSWKHYLATASKSASLWGLTVTSPYFFFHFRGPPGVINPKDSPIDRWGWPAHRGQCHPRDPFRLGKVENVHANAKEALQGHGWMDGHGGWERLLNEKMVPFWSLFVWSWILEISVSYMNMILFYNIFFFSLFDDLFRIMYRIHINNMFHAFRMNKRLLHPVKACIKAIHSTCQGLDAAGSGFLWEQLEWCPRLKVRKKKTTKKSLGGMDMTSQEMTS